MTEEQKQLTRERIGRRIAALRKVKGMTQEQLADLCGLQRTHIARIETGRYAVNFETIQAIAEAMGMTADIVEAQLADLAPLRSLNQ